MSDRADHYRTVRNQAFESIMRQHMIAGLPNYVFTIHGFRKASPYIFTFTISFN